MKDAPCYGCQDRRVGCHATCELYKRFVDDKNGVKTAKFLAEVKAAKLDSFRNAGIAKALRKSGKKVKQ